MTTNQRNKVRKSSRSRKVRKSSRSRKVRKSSRSRKVRKSSRSRKVRKSSRSRKQFDGTKSCENCNIYLDDSISKCSNCKSTKLKRLTDDQERKKAEELSLLSYFFENKKNEQKMKKAEELSSSSTDVKLREIWVHNNFSEIHSVMMAYLIKTNDEEPFYFYDKFVNKDKEYGQKIYSKTTEIPNFSEFSLGPRDTYRFIINDRLSRYFDESSDIKKFRIEIIDPKTVSITAKNILFSILSDLLKIPISFDDKIYGEEYDNSKKIYIKSKNKEGYCIPLVDEDLANKKLSDKNSNAYKWREGMFNLLIKKADYEHSKEIIENIRKDPFYIKGEGKGEETEKNNYISRLVKGKKGKGIGDVDPRIEINSVWPTLKDLSDVPRDGDCLFHALRAGLIILGLYKEENDANDLRVLIVEELKILLENGKNLEVPFNNGNVHNDNPDNILTFGQYFETQRNILNDNLERDVKQYLLQMKVPKTWGTEIEIWMASKIFDVNINVYTYPRDPITNSPTDKNLNLKLTTINYTSSEENVHKKTIRIFNETNVVGGKRSATRGVHYQLLPPSHELTHYLKKDDS